MQKSNLTLSYAAWGTKNMIVDLTEAGTLLCQLAGKLLACDDKLRDAQRTLRAAAKLLTDAGQQFLLSNLDLSEPQQEVQYHD